LVFNSAARPQVAIAISGQRERVYPWHGHCAVGSLLWRRCSYPLQRRRFFVKEWRGGVKPKGVRAHLNGHATDKISLTPVRKIALGGKKLSLFAPSEKPFQGGKSSYSSPRKNRSRVPNCPILRPESQDLRPRSCLWANRSRWPNEEWRATPARARRRSARRGHRR
jgi:hypothetical protein